MGASLRGVRYMNRQRLAMLEFWRKAYKDGEAMVELPTESMGVTARFALYEVAKAVTFPTAPVGFPRMVFAAI